MIRKNQAVVFAVILCLFSAIPNAIGQRIPDNIIGKFHYRSIGPTRQSGRITDFAVPVGVPYTFYVATGSGGLWKTEDNGTTYVPIFDHEHSIAIGDIAVAASNPEIVWVGTGEANGDYTGDGVYKSSDGGDSWTNMGLRKSSRIGRIRIHPDNADIVYVAATGLLKSQNPERGVYKTTDGGKSWTKSLEVVNDGWYTGAVDLVMDPRDPDVLYAASYEHEDSRSTSETGSGIYKTQDGGTSWKKLTDGLPEDGMARIGLDIYLGNPDILYAVIHMPQDSPDISQNRVYRTDNAGSSWKRLGQPAGAGLGNGAYFGQIRVNPKDQDHIYVMSVNMYESKDGGNSWDIPHREEQQRKHVRVDFYDDHHAMWIDPNDPNHILLGTDHGMGITYNAGETWYHPDEMPLAQLYAIAVDMDYPYNVYGGTQDNGNFRGPSTKKGQYPIRLEDWQYFGTGDGGYSQVDPSNTRWLYNESQNGDIERIDQKTGIRKYIQYKDNPDLRFNFVAPILISRYETNVIYQGANVLLRSPDRGDSWDEISPDLTTETDDVRRRRARREKRSITTLDQSPIEEGIIWVGTDNGNVQLTRDEGKTWKKLNDHIPNNPKHWVSRVVASHHAPGRAYVSFTGRGRDDFRPYVYVTHDYGENWKSIAADLPDEPINVIREDHKNPNLLFVGNDKSVYVTIDAGENWTSMKNNMPTQPVHDLVIHPRENDLVVGTYGRGFFITDISPLQELTEEVLDEETHFFQIEPKVQWVIPREIMVSSQNFSGENEPYGLMVNYYLKESVDADVSVTVYKDDRLLATLSGAGAAGLNRVEWRMNTWQERTEEEKEQWKRHYKGFMDQPFTKYQQVFYHDVEFDHNSPNHIGSPVPPGEYTVKLSVGGKELSQSAVILEDKWFVKYY